MPIAPRKSQVAHRAGGFTSLEMLTTVAVLILLLGLMVDLAGYVRNRSATDLARTVLAGLDTAMEQDPADAQRYPSGPAFTHDPQLRDDEDQLLANARQNNRDF